MNPDQIENWVFDLDNTLYVPSTHVSAQVETRMRDFVASHFRISPEEARARQKAYYRKYGTTLRGMMVEHGLHPDAYLDYVHDLDLTSLDPSPRLDQALARLPGRKVIFTNATLAHAENVLRRIGIAHHFDDMYDIEAAEFLPKPEPEIYEKAMRRFGIAPKGAAMLDDLVRNLRPAHDLGMTTVWVCQPGHIDWAIATAGDHSHIHHVAKDLTAWLEAAATPLP